MITAMSLSQALLTTKTQVQQKVYNSKENNKLPLVKTLR